VVRITRSAVRSTLLPVGVAAVVVAIAFQKSSACGWTWLAGICAFVVAVESMLRAPLRRKSTAELEEQVWHYEPDYFRTLGEHEACVVEFKRIVERRDLAEMSARWPVLRDAFARLERKAGYWGRDAVEFDPYPDQSWAIAELVRRSREGTRRATR
jgi:hypothetical protein